MWTWLKEFLFGKKSTDEPMLVQALGEEMDPLEEEEEKDTLEEEEEKDSLEEEVNRKELSFLEEIKIILGENSLLFTSGYAADFNFISTDYVDDEGLKALRILGFHNTINQVLVIFEGVMKDGTFDVGNIRDMQSAFRKRMNYVQLEYNESRLTLDVIVSLSRDLTVDDERQRELVMGTLYKMAGDIRLVMPDIRRQYGQS